MRISVFGMGHVGCVTAACLADAGHHVVGVDVNPDRVATLNAARSPMVEPGLADLLAKVVAAQRFRATTSSADAITDSDLSLVCVGTPPDANGRLDTSAIEQVGKEIGRVLLTMGKPYTIVLRSTVLPGITEGVFTPAIQAGHRGETPPTIRVAVNPEFMREGASLQDFADPPFILAGCADLATADLLKSMYHGVAAPFVHTTIRTAEMVKHTANAFHALKMSFANEIGDVCQALGADAQEVMELLRLDRKLNISGAYLRPGFAFGGPCLSKDLRALLHAARGADLALPLISAILPSNDLQIRQGVEAVLKTGKRRVGIVGLSFKPGTDDLSESPMVRLVQALLDKGCAVRIFDQNVSTARANSLRRRADEEELSHIASLVYDDLGTLLAHAEVLVIGHAGEEAAKALAAAGPDHVVVDLTRGQVHIGRASGQVIASLATPTVASRSSTTNDRR
jgi:GDP-mannose 6-dehydrogenase